MYSGSVVARQNWYYCPTNWFVPKIAKIVKMNMMKKKTRIRPGIEPRSDCICCLIVGIRFIERSGLRIRNVLRDFKLSEPPFNGRNPMTLTMTMKKSRQLKGSRR